MLLLAVSVESRVRQVGLVAVFALEITAIIVVLGPTGLLLAASRVDVLILVIRRLSLWLRLRGHLVLLELGEEPVASLDHLLRRTVARLIIALELLLT